MLIELVYTQYMLELSIKKRPAFIAVWPPIQATQESQARQYRKYFGSSGECYVKNNPFLKQTNKNLISAIQWVYLSNCTSKGSLLRKIILHVASFILFWQKIQIFSDVTNVLFITTDDIYLKNEKNKSNLLMLCHF